MGRIADAILGPRRDSQDVKAVEDYTAALDHGRVKPGQPEAAQAAARRLGPAVMRELERGR
jgi:hypothetical protein